MYATHARIFCLPATPVFSLVSRLAQLNKAHTRKHAQLYMFVSLITCPSDQASFDEDLSYFVYDAAPELHIMGRGFDSLDMSTLELRFRPELQAGTDYALEIQSPTVLVLTLKHDKK